MNNIYLKKEDIADFDCIRESTLEKMGIKKDLISIEEILLIMEDLYFDKENLEEKVENLEQQIRENYKPISPYEMYGISEREFH